MDAIGTPEVEGFFDPETASVTYLVTDPGTGRCAVIDPVLGYDPVSARTSTEPLAAVTARIRERGLTVEWLIDTHIHADHLSGLARLEGLIGGRTAIGFGAPEIQRHFAAFFGFEPGFPADGSQWTHRFADGESFALGGIPASAFHVPGHTPACMAYLIGDALFVGDTIFMPDYGSARCDFPGGDATALYRSVRRLLALPPTTRIFVGHDYAPGGRETLWETSVAAQRAGNIHLRDGVSEAEFVAMRTERDVSLGMPRLFMPAVQVNVRGGNLPPREASGMAYIKMPVDMAEAGRPRSPNETR